MWKIIGAELRYDRRRIGLFLLLSLAAFLTIWLGVKWERNRIPMIMLMTLVLTFSAVYAGEVMRTIQKRDRLHVLLPVPLWHIGTAHFLSPLVVLSFIFGLLFASVQIARPMVHYSVKMPSIAAILTLTGLILIVNAVILLGRDLRQAAARKSLRFLILVCWFVVYVGALIPFYVVTNFFGLFGENTATQDFLGRMLESPSGFLFFGLLLSALSFAVFVKRKSYVDS